MATPRHSTTLYPDDFKNKDVWESLIGDLRGEADTTPECIDVIIYPVQPHLNEERAVSILTKRIDALDLTVSNLANTTPSRALINELEQAIRGRADGAAFDGLKMEVETLRSHIIHHTTKLDEHEGDIAGIRERLNQINDELMFKSQSKSNLEQRVETIERRFKSLKILVCAEPDTEKP